VLLWIISLFQPIFLTRYIAYSGLAFALLLGILISSERSRAINVLTVAAVISYSILNVSNVINYRDNQYNWDLKLAAISSGPSDSALVSSPEWYTPMITFHSANDRRIEKLSNLESIALRKPSLECERFPKMVWLIGISNTIEDIDERRIKMLGYVRQQSGAKVVPGSALYMLHSCVDVK
jgi:hypothetical protein